MKMNILRTKISFFFCFHMISLLHFHICNLFSVLYLFITSSLHFQSQYVSLPIFILNQLKFKKFDCLSTLNGSAYKQPNHVVLANRLVYDYKLPIGHQAPKLQSRVPRLCLAFILFFFFFNKIRKANPPWTSS